MQPTKVKQLTILNHTKGGIGNQLFQHVFARSLARKMGGEMLTDVSYFGADPYGFQARVWSLQPDAKTATVDSVAGPGSYLMRDGQIESLQDVVELPADARVLVLSGYWQREALLDPEIVRETYAQLAQHAQSFVAAELLTRLQTCPNAVAVHLRRRDYGHMGLCKDSYYLAAIEHLLINFPGAELFVFSDEPNYARHLLQSRGLAFTAVSSGHDLGDLYLMSLCRHFVIANSSYSWWAAYFGEAKGGTICAPKEWVTIDSTPSPCPDRWINITGAIQPFQINKDEVNFFATQLKKAKPTL